MLAKKTKAKQWISILSPKMFGEREIGKTLTNDLEKIIGRKISISAVYLTENFSKYYLKIILKIDKIDGDKALTSLAGTQILNDYISRMVLRRVRKVDAVQDLNTRDGKKIRVKSLTIIGRRVNSSIQSAIRNKVREMVQNFVMNQTLDQFIEKVITDEMKNQILQESRKTYPVRNFEFRRIDMLK